MTPLRPEAIEAADRAFDGVLSTGGEPSVLLEGLLLASACYARQHRVSIDGLHRMLGVAWGYAADGLPGFSIEVATPGDLEAALRRAVE